MKKLQIFALLCLSTVLIFTSCQKENITTDATSFELDQMDALEMTKPGFDFNNLEKTTKATSIESPKPLVTVVREGAHCIVSGLNLHVYQVVNGDLEIPIDLDKFYVEWFNDDYVLLSETSDAYCLNDGTYLIIVWNKITGETSAQTYTIGDNTDDRLEQQTEDQ